MRLRIQDLIEEKLKVEQNLGKLVFNKSVYVRLALFSISRDICIYRQQNVALLHRYEKIFPKQTIFLSLIRLDLSKKKPGHPESQTGTSDFCNFSFELQYVLFFILDLVFLFFHASHTLELQISSCFLLFQSLP
jgi:hypothetical protein